MGEGGDVAAAIPAPASAEGARAVAAVPEGGPQTDALDPLERLLSLLEPQKPRAAEERFEPVLGILIIDNPEAGLKAYLDEVPLGEIGQGPFENIEPGDYRLELRGDGRSMPERFGSATVSITAGKRTYISVEPIPYGRIEYRIPDGATAVVEGPDRRIPVTGEGMLRFLPIGEYVVEVTFPGYLKTRETISVNRNQTVGFFPSSPSGTGSGITIAGGEPQDRPPSTAVPPLPGAGLDEMESAAITPSPITAEQRNRELRVSQLSVERTALIERIEKARKQKKALTTGQWISYCTGLAALGGMGAALYFGSQSYEDYQDAVYTDDAVALREKTQLFQGIAIGTGVLGGLGIAGGTVLLAINPSIERLERRVALLDAEIEKLKSESE
jgi:hypothetical protein